MNRLIDAIENRLSAEDKERLQAIYAPTVVATPLADARRHVCILRDGEIRSYGEVGGSHVTPRCRAVPSSPSPWTPTPSAPTR